MNIEPLMALYRSSCPYLNQMVELITASSQPVDRDMEHRYTLLILQDHHVFVYDPNNSPYGPGSIESFLCIAFIPDVNTSIRSTMPLRFVKSKSYRRATNK